MTQAWLSEIDSPHIKHNSAPDSGLYDAMNRFKTIDEIKTFTFDIDDVVRNPIISKILKLYNKIEVIKTTELLIEGNVSNIPKSPLKDTPSLTDRFKKISKLIKW